MIPLANSSRLMGRTRQPRALARSQCCPRPGGLTLLEVLGAVVIMGMLVTAVLPLLRQIQRHVPDYEQRRQAEHRLLQWDAATLAAWGPGRHPLPEEAGWVVVIGNGQSGPADEEWEHLHWHRVHLEFDPDAAAASTAPSAPPPNHQPPAQTPLASHWRLLPEGSE